MGVVRGVVLPTIAGIAGLGGFIFLGAMTDKRVKELETMARTQFVGFDKQLPHGLLNKQESENFVSFMARQDGNNQLSTEEMLACIKECIFLQQNDSNWTSYNSRETTTNVLNAIDSILKEQDKK